MPGSERTFFEESARGRVTAAIKEVEAQTSAEVVVSVKNATGAYRDVDYLVGFAASVAVLLVLLFDPFEFATEGMPLEVVAAFAAGAFGSSRLPALRRALTSKKRREEAALQAARAAFVTLGVGRTQARNGILVLVSVFERRAAVVADVGIDGEKLGAEWRERVHALESSLDHGPDFERFVETLRALGPILGAAMPRQADDVNELPDEVAG
jgi:putative membrane protein